MLTERIEEGLTFDDVILVPEASSVLPQQVNLHTRLSRNIDINIPLLSAAMDTVTEYRTAICLAQEGGIGVIHKNMEIEKQARQVDLVKRSESGMISDPITIDPDAPISKALELMNRYRISGVPVTRGKVLVGILTNRDLRFETNASQSVSALMTKGKDNLVTVKNNINLNDSKMLLHKHRIEKLLVVNDEYELVGMITVKDIEKARLYPNSCKDSKGRLRVGAAVGPGKEVMLRVEALVSAGVDLIVLDTAHGHSEKVLKVTKEIRTKYPDLELMVGNIATAEAAEELLKIGVDAIKVGVGGGSICTTRVVTGVGMPQLTAIQAVVSVSRSQEVPVVSDGGIKYSGDIVKALAAGADSVMLGNLFAGTDETPGQVILYKGRRYKKYRGMGSLSAMNQGSRDRYFQEQDKENVQEQENSMGVESGKLVPEGVESRVPYRGPLSESIHQCLGGVRAGMGYVGATDIPSLYKRTRFVRMTNYGLRESHVHDVHVIDEAPNYPLFPATD